MEWGIFCAIPRAYTGCNHFFLYPSECDDFSRADKLIIVFAFLLEYTCLRVKSFLFSLHEYVNPELMKIDNIEQNMSRGEKLLAEAMAFYFDRAHDDFLEPVDDDAYVIGYDACEDEGFSAAAEDEMPYGLDE